MATRAFVRVLDENGKIVTEIYKHFDGYPSHTGKKIKEFIDSGALVNGITDGITKDGKREFNGIGDFAALLVWYLKNGESGDVYLYDMRECYVPKDFWNKLHIEYLYVIKVVNDILHLSCFDTFTGKKIEDF